MVQFFKGPRRMEPSAIGGACYYIPLYFSRDGSDKKFFVGDLLESAPYNKQYEAYHLARSSEEEGAWRWMLEQSNGRSINDLATWFLGNPCMGTDRPEEFVEKTLSEGNTFDEQTRILQERVRAYVPPDEKREPTGEPLPGETVWRFQGKVKETDIPFSFTIFDRTLAEEIAGRTGLTLK